MFKEKLKELREQKGLSQYELADCIFVSRSTIAKWENGLGMPGKASMDSLCEFFNITKEELLKDEEGATSFRVYFNYMDGRDYYMVNVNLNKVVTISGKSIEWLFSYFNINCDIQIEIFNNQEADKTFIA